MAVYFQLEGPIIVIKTSEATPYLPGRINDLQSPEIEIVLDVYIRVGITREPVNAVTSIHQVHVKTASVSVGPLEDYYIRSTTFREGKCYLHVLHYLPTRPG